MKLQMCNQPGGILYGMANAKWDDKPTIEWELASPEVDLLCKVLEMAVHIPGKTGPAFQLGRELHAMLVRESVGVRV